jgi:hypothetical protein
VQFMLMLKGDPETNPQATPELYAAIGKLTEEMVRSGIMVQTGGYAILEVESREQAIELARRFLELHSKIMGKSYVMESEVRQMFPVAEFSRKAEAPIPASK